MPQLKWDAIDFMDCLEVFPQIEDYETSHYYEVHKNGLVLAITVWQYDSIVAISLFQEGSEVPITSFKLIVRGEIRYFNDKRGQYLEFNDCVFFVNFYDHIESWDEQKKTGMSSQLRVAVSIKPDLRVRFE